MKTKTYVLKTKSGKVVHTAYPWDDARNREWNRKRCEAKTGEQLKYERGPLEEIINP